MVNFDEIEFLECEIVDDDPSAPVGTWVHILDDGTVEEVVKEVASDVEELLLDTEDEPILDEEVASSQPEIGETVSQDVQEDSSASDDTIDVLVEDNVNEAAEESEPVLIETIETSDDTANIAPVIDDIQDAQPVEDVQDAPILEDAMPIEPAGGTENEVEPAVTAQEDSAPVLTSEEVVPTFAETSEVVEQPIEEKKAPNRRKPVKRMTAQTKDRVEVATYNLNLSGNKNVNDALFDTSFEIEQPQKAKVVSTKKKQEKAEDLWAVATVNKSKKAQETPQNTDVEAPVAPKKRAPKKSTNVEDTQNTTTEEKKKVAKATEKTAKAETKTAKTDAKATTPEVKEEKVAKTKTTKKAQPAVEPVVKEEKAPKATAKPHDSDETVIIEGEGRMHGKYVIKKTDKGNFVFKLYSSNYRVVAIGAQAYTTLGAAKIGIQSVINNAEKAPVENQTLKNYETLKFPKWEIYLDKKGEYRLRLFATNGSLIATTNDGYADISGAKNGIAAVARASKGCAIVRNDNLW